MRVTGVEAVLLRAAFPDRLRDFYGALFDAAFEPTEEGGYVADLGGLRFAIGPGAPPGTTRPRIAPMFVVTDIEGALDSLDGAEALVRDAYESMEGRFAFLFDPEGNELALFEPTRISTLEGL